ncbi:MAG: winged helix DNA-binding domain-containing protein [Candidatus Korarchaeota archaeon]|nr:winged helix DNA-binding domain-containing protein [Candidatus Korarchaeota archaeon]NIU82244.1 hypothetical protein [Candidatus Thorarchaeota archaeon]NIW15585.1 hypothetical protein [Candidatus Thorarchaeota archaeon]
MIKCYSKETCKEFVLRRLHLTPNTLGKEKGDVPTIVSDIGGLQYGGHELELFSRFTNFHSSWYDYWFQNHTLIEGHVLRGALRIVTLDEYPSFFKATRSVARRRRYQACPTSLNVNHHLALTAIEHSGPVTPSEFKVELCKEHPDLEKSAKKLLYDLYNYGKVVRVGRRKNKPLYHVLDELPSELDLSQTSEKEAKRWLLRTCLSIYGPFTVKDIAHWVRWRITETRNILDDVLKTGKVTEVRVEEDQRRHFACTKDLDVLDSFTDKLPEYSFVRILFNDDALLLGYYKRLHAFFGYDWCYPQFSEGVSWRAGILYGRELIGEAIVDKSARSPTFEIKNLILRKAFSKAHILSKVKARCRKHAEYLNKRLKIRKITEQ